MREIKQIIIHHSASSLDKTSLKSIDDWHKKRWPTFKSKLGYYVGYHYVIGKNYVMQTRLDEEIGAHCLGYNENSIGICLIGNFDVEKPTDYQLTELTNLLNTLAVKYHQPLIKKHCELAATACPGKNLIDVIVFKTIEDKVDKFAMLLSDLENLIKKYK